jgi:hypothetical protein
MCKVVLDDPLVSRTHARFIVVRSAVTVQDLGSANGVLVNGERIGANPVPLGPGDRVAIGQQTMQLMAAQVADDRRELRARAQTLTSLRSFTDDGGSEPTRKGDAIDLLIGVADKVLALGRGEEAERILSSYLRNFLAVSKSRTDVDVAVAAKAATYAVRIAEATGKGSWVDYAFELYGVVKRPLPGPVVDRLYDCMRRLSPVSANVFRQYLSALRSAESELGPADRFLMRRIEGLEALGALK